jgi:hypothetical protein
MLHLIQNPDLLDQVIALNTNQQHDPMKIIDDFFSDYGLSGIRKWSWDISQAFITSDNPEFDNPVLRVDALTFYKHLIQFVEATFILRGVHLANKMQNSA